MSKIYNVVIWVFGFVVFLPIRERTTFLDFLALFQCFFFSIQALASYRKSHSNSKSFVPMKSQSSLFIFLLLYGVFVQRRSIPLRIAVTLITLMKTGGDKEQK